MRTFASLLLGIALVAPAHSATIHVPGDQPTIQAGINAAATGDTVEVACGTYLEHDVSLESGITLRSETGNADCVTIDAQGLGQGIRGWNISEPTLVEALTIVNGDGNLGGGLSLLSASVLVRNCVIRDCTAGHGGGVVLAGAPPPSIEDCLLLNNSAEYMGGGVKLMSGVDTDVIRCRFQGNHSDLYGGGIGADTPTSLVQECSFVENSAARFGGGIWAKSQCDIVNCELLGNTAVQGGGGVAVTQSSPALSGCTLYENTTPGHGGGLYFHSAAPSVSQCTIVFNGGGTGAGGVFSGFGSLPAIDHTVIAFSTLGAAFSVHEPDGVGQPELSCCDIYGNLDGDWVGAIADQAGLNGNFSTDPLFCDPGNGDFTLQSNSPCAPPGVTGCGLVGASPVGCGAISIDATSWGAIKERYRGTR